MAAACPVQPGQCPVGGDFTDVGEVPLSVVEWRNRRIGVAPWRRGVSWSGVEVVWHHRATAAPGVVGDMHLTEDASVLPRLIRREVRDQAPIRLGCQADPLCAVYAPQSNRSYM
jgi:hypothetical protein